VRKNLFMQKADYRTEIMALKSLFSAFQNFDQSRRREDAKPHFFEVSVIRPKGKSENPGQGRRMGVFRVAIFHVFHRFFKKLSVSWESVPDDREDPLLKPNEICGKLVFLGHHGQIFLDFPAVKIGNVNSY